MTQCTHTSQARLLLFWFWCQLIWVVDLVECADDTKTLPPTPPPASHFSSLPFLSSTHRLQATTIEQTADKLLFLHSRLLTSFHYIQQILLHSTQTKCLLLLLPKPLRRLPPRRLRPPTQLTRTVRDIFVLIHILQNANVSPTVITDAIITVSTILH